ncbi:hypothetical protein [Crossiella sp. NPDC003009]
MVKSEGLTAQFQVTFSKANRLVVADGQLQVGDSADRVVDAVGPRLATPGRAVGGALLGGPVGARLGIGTRIAAAAAFSVGVLAYWLHRSQRKFPLEG